MQVSRKIPTGNKRKRIYTIHKIRDRRTACVYVNVCMYKYIIYMTRRLCKNDDLDRIYGKGDWWMNTRRPEADPLLSQKAE